MNKFVLKLNNVHYDTLSNESFEFTLSITCEYITELDKKLLKTIAEHQVISYMIATGKNFLRDHAELLKYLNSYALSKFIKIIKIGESKVSAFPIEVEKTKQSIKISSGTKELNSVTTE